MTILQVRKSTLIPKTIVAEPVADLEDIPSEVSADYSTDLDIESIHCIILKRLLLKVRWAAALKRDVADIDTEIKSFNGTKLAWSKLTLEREVLSATIRDYSLDQSQEYLSRSQGVVDRYKLLTKSTFVLSTRTSRIDDKPISHWKTSKRLKVIEEYLDIAKDYITVNVVHRRNAPQTCLSCAVEIDEDLEDLGVCACGYAFPTISRQLPYKDSTRVNGAPHTHYEDVKNFTKAFQALQGKQPNADKIYTDELETLLDKYFKSVGMKSGAWYRKQPRLANGKKTSTSFLSMIDALESIGMPEHYGNGHLISKYYWGWELLELSDLADVIAKDYADTQKVWDRIKDRDSSPNVKIRLYLHLRARGIQCDTKDFKFPVTNTCVSYYNCKLKIMFEECSLKFEELI